MRLENVTTCDGIKLPDRMAQKDEDLSVSRAAK